MWVSSEAGRRQTVNLLIVFISPFFTAVFSFSGLFVDVPPTTSQSEQHETTGCLCAGDRNTSRKNMVP